MHFSAARQVMVSREWNTNGTFGIGLMATRRAKTFPWGFLFLAWIILFPYQNQLDPRNFDQIEIGDLVGSTQNGNLIHQCLACLLGIVGCLAIRGHGSRLKVRGLVAPIFIVYLGWILLSAFWTDDFAITIRRQLAFGMILLFCVGCCARMGRETIALFIAGLAGLNLAAAIIQELLRGTLRPFAPGNRFEGTVSPNVQGAVLSIALIVTLWHAWKCIDGRRATYLALAAVFSSFTLMTGSRTSAIGLVGALAAWGILMCLRKYKRDHVRVLTVVSLMLALSTGAILVSMSGIQLLRTSGISDMIRTERDSGEVTELTGRDMVWKMCFRYAEAHPLTGYGYGAFWTPSRLDAVADELGWAVPHAHSAYLDTLLQLGVPGLIIYTSLLISSIGVCLGAFFKGDDSAALCLALLIFLAINGITESTVLLPTLPAIVMILLWLTLSLERSPGKDRFALRPSNERLNA
jgi:exopolysaccharide production protein ExoQ